MKVMRQKMNKIIEKIMNMTIWSFGILLLLFLFQLFCFASFKIPSDSMSPALKDGDRILVNKLIMGPRLFNVSKVLRGEEVDIYRLPGLQDLKRNDVLVFNFPYQKGRWDMIHMDIMKYYVKRCIALPGDTLEIKKGFYEIRGCDDMLGNRKAQSDLADVKDPGKYGIITRTFPRDKYLNWTISEFGPLPIPREGQTVMMNRKNYLLYRQLINWEQKEKLGFKDGQVLLGDSVIYRYCFRKNYYFVSGDHLVNSQDSRYWGMLPEEYIVGKATLVWYSEDKHTGKPRWERIMKKIE